MAKSSVRGLVAQRLFDLSDDLGRLGEQDEQFPPCRMDGETRGNGAPDPRERQKVSVPPRDIYVPTS